MIICRSATLSQEGWNDLKTYPNLSILDSTDIHSKAFLNEHTGIVSSMNYYDYSTNYNLELGILFSVLDEGPYSLSRKCEESLKISVLRLRKLFICPDLFK